MKVAHLKIQLTPEEVEALNRMHPTLSEDERDTLLSDVGRRAVESHVNFAIAMQQHS